MDRFNERSIRLAAAGLERWKKIAFIALCCERMVPNYRNFVEETGFGNIQILEDALFSTWEWLESEKDIPHLSQLRIQVENQAPNTENFSSVYTSAALDAVNSISLLLDALHSETSDVVSVACLARDSVDLFVQELGDLDPNKPGFEEEIQKHELMRAEVFTQSQQLKYLSQWSGARKEAIRYLRRKYLPSIGSLSIQK